MKLDDAIAVYRALIERPAYYPTLERTHPKSYRVTMPFGHVELDAMTELQGIVQETATEKTRIRFYTDGRELGNHEPILEDASAPVSGIVSIR